MSLREAVAQAIRESGEGIELLQSPKRFWACIADMGATETPEGYVLGDHCDARILYPFYEAAQAEPSALDGALHSAASKAADLLDYMSIKNDVALGVANGIAGGIADYLGVTWVPLAQTQVVTPNPPTTVPNDNPLPNYASDDIPLTPNAPIDDPQPPASAPDPGTKKNVALIVAIALVVVAAIVAAVVFLSKGPNTSSSVDSSSALSSSSVADDEHAIVSDIIAKAEKCANEDDYEEAYAIIKEGLKDHPDSEDLKKKSEEYARERDEIENIIDRAEGNVSNGSYDRALEVIEGGLETYPKSRKLQNERDAIAKRRDEAQQEAEREAEKKQEAEQEQKSEPASEPEPKAESKSEASFNLPSSWYGSYTGNSLDSNGNHIPVTRMLWLNIDESNGHITGTCSVGKEDGSSNVEGSFYVEGTLDHQTREINIWGTEWISSGNLNGMRNFWGTVSGDLSSMSGECQGTSSGEVGGWSASVQ